MAEAFHVLPLSGGLFDQPGGYIKRMVKVLEATQKSEEVDAKRREAQQRLEDRTSE